MGILIHLSNSFLIFSVVADPLRFQQSHKKNQQLLLTVPLCNLGCNGIGLLLSHRSLRCGTDTPGNSFSHNDPQDKADRKPCPVYTEKNLNIRFGIAGQMDSEERFVMKEDQDRVTHLVLILEMPDSSPALNTGYTSGM